MRVLRGSSVDQALPVVRPGASAAVSSNTSRRRPFCDEDAARAGGAGVEKTSVESERAGPAPVRPAAPDLLDEDEEAAVLGTATLPNTVLRGAVVVEAGGCIEGAGSDSAGGAPAVVIILF